MYKVFVNDKPIILTDKVEEEIGFKNYLLKTVSLGKVIKELNKTSLKEVRLIHKNEKKILKKFLKKLPLVIAAGGKVHNSKGEILFIFRNGKWDLPKGKIEKGEDLEATAIREVEEETGIKKLQIVQELDTTYHIFKRNGNHKIKKTHWFEMKSDYNGKLKPEESEGITDVKWLNGNDISAALENSYANIRELI